MKKIIPFLMLFVPNLGFGAILAYVAAGAGIGLAGFSIYRSMAPVNMNEAFDFFSSCWSCQMFGDIMKTMSDLVPRAYNGIGEAMVPIVVVLTTIWLIWYVVFKYWNIGGAKGPSDNAWSVVGATTGHFIKLSVVIILLLAPLPKIVSSAFVEPVFTIGLSANRILSSDEKTSECLIATAISETPTTTGAFSPHLRHNMTCELARVHQMTAVGMTIGWTMLNMAFNADYMHKIANVVPVFPNIPIFLAGFILLVLFFWTLLPVPLYFLQVFIKLTINLILLPMFLLGWLFSDWKDFIPGYGGKSIQDTVDEVIKGVCGIALLGIFVSFVVIFLNTVFGETISGESALGRAFATGDSKILMDGLLMNNDSFVMILIMGLFAAMLMTSIPNIMTELFKDIRVPDEFYKTTKDNVQKIVNGIKKTYTGIKAVKDKK